MGAFLCIGREAGKREMRLYHYTVLKDLVSIVEDGQIDPSKTVTPDEREKPVVWLTTKPDWEETGRLSLWRWKRRGSRMLSAVVIS